MKSGLKSVQVRLAPKELDFAPTPIPHRPEPAMLLELARPLSFFLGMFSLYPVMLSAFFVPGAHWEERLEMALLRVALAACICFASGLLYAWPP